MFFGVGDEVIHVGFDGINATVHSRDSIALSCHANANASFGAKLLVQGVGAHERSDRW